MRKIIFTILCLFAITMVAGIACASDANNLTTNVTDLDDSLAVDEDINVTDFDDILAVNDDVNGTASDVNSSENDTEVIDANHTVKNTAYKLDIKGPKPSDLSHLNLHSPFPYNYLEDGYIRGLYNEWSARFEQSLTHMSFQDAYHSLLYDFQERVMVDSWGVGARFDYDDRPFIGMLYVIVNHHRQLGDHISFGKIRSYMWNYIYDEWADNNEWYWD